MSSKKAKFVKSKSGWLRPYQSEHPTDKLKIRHLLSERVTGSRIAALEARIDPGQVHQLHTHKNEYVIVYCLKGKCVVTAGDETRSVNPKTIIFIPPRVPHRFHNKSSKAWYGIAFAIGTNSKIQNEWLES